MVRVVLMSVALMVGIGKQNPDVRGEEDSTFGRTVCVSALRGREGIVFRSETQLPVASCFEVTSTYTSHVCTLIRGKIGGCVWRPSNENLVEGFGS